VVWLGNIPLRLAFRAREGVVVWLGNIALRLAFEAREGGGCVDKKKTPSPSRISSEGGGGGVVRKRPPLSRVSSEGGVEGVSTKETPPPSRVSSEGGGGDGGRASTEKLPPSVSRFEQGKGWGWFQAREGVEMVVVVCRQRKIPLRLAF
jgi:hypothetical protein